MSRSGKNFLLCLFLLLTGTALFAQTVRTEVYQVNNYTRTPLFLEQDLIYERTVSFVQGLELICVQDKVKVEIEGIGTFYTPVDLNNIPAGDYSLTLSKTGYYPHHFRITISSDGRTSVVVELKEYLSTVILTGLPEDSIIYVNNQKVESHRMSLPIGDVSLRISAFGYEEYREIINITGDSEQIFKPELVKKDFNLRGVRPGRETLWTNDSPSQKKTIITVTADAPGTGDFSIIRASDGKTVQSGTLIFSQPKTEIPFDLNNLDPDINDLFLILINGTDGKIVSEVESEITVLKGSKSYWRNNLNGFSGFIYTPTAEVLPKGVSQLQTAVSPAYTAHSINDLFIPAIISLRTVPVQNLELGLGMGLYISTEQNETSLDLFASFKYSFFTNDGSNGFTLAAGLSANYIGLTSSFEAVPSYDPLAGLSGLSLILPFQFRVKPFTFVLTPEIRFSPSYPGIADGGFSGDTYYIWNYFRAAASIDLGGFSLALSAALQSPSYINSVNRWPFSAGLELNTTPGRSGFSFSLFAGMRYISGETIQFTSGLSAGFIF